MKTGRITTDHLLAAASTARKKATPRDSGFAVGAAAEVVSRVTGRGRIVPGYNKESDFGRSNHAEVGLVARLRPDELIRRLVCLGGREQQEAIVTPCGGCRADLVTYAEPDAVVLLPAEAHDSWFPIHQLLPRPVSTIYSDKQPNVPRDEVELYDRAIELIENKPLRFLPRPAHLPPLPLAAALLTDGEMFASTLIDNAAYWTGHPEVLVIGQADAVRERKIDTLLLVYPSHEPGEFAYPCGPCLQFVYEYAEVGGEDFRVVLANLRAEFMALSFRSLLPHPFGPRDMGIDLTGFA